MHDAQAAALAAVSDGKTLTFTLDEAWALLKISRATGHNLLKAGEIGSYTVGKRRFIHMGAMKDFIERQVAATQARV